MAMFVHLAPGTRIKPILRNGIARLRRPCNGQPGGIFSMPVTSNFFVSHQWLRELRRGRDSHLAAVYFRIPDEEPVWVGRYGQTHEEMTAAVAVALMMQPGNHTGFEVIIPHKIDRKAIHRVKELPQVIGWRYFPGSHGTKPCGCPGCQRGQFGSRKLREAYEMG